MNLSKSRFSNHEYDPETETIFSYWFKETANMTRDDFKNEIQEWLNLFRMVKPKYLYDDCINFHYPIIPEDQVWMARLLNTEWVKLGLKKYAHMVPSEMIAELSVEQLFEEFFKMKLKNQFPISNFAKRENALEWLHE